MKKKYYSVESVFGGKDFYDEKGRFIGHSVPGIGGGEDFYGVDGETGYTVDSVLSGEDFYGSDGTRAYSLDNPLGGKTYAAIYPASPSIVHLVGRISSWMMTAPILSSAKLGAPQNRIKSTAPAGSSWTNPRKTDIGKKSPLL